MSIPCTTVFAIGNTTELPELNADSFVDTLALPAEPPVSPQAFVRHFHSFNYGEHAYDYENELFKIGDVRIDNSPNQYTPASGVFTIEQSGSCSITITTGMSLGITCGVEVDAIFAQAEFQFHEEVATEIAWTAGQQTEATITVPPGQIGKLTGYVVGMYYGGTATYALENMSTGAI